MSEDIQQQILNEIRTQVAISRKSYKVATVISCVFLAVITTLMAVTPFLFRTAGKSISSPLAADSWQEARNLLVQGEHQKSEKMIGRLIKKYPRFYYGYTLRGSLYLELVNLAEAEKNYSVAYDLLPTEENEKMLAAVRKALSKNDRNGVK